MRVKKMMSSDFSHSMRANFSTTSKTSPSSKLFICPHSNGSPANKQHLTKQYRFNNYNFNPSISFFHHYFQSGYHLSCLPTSPQEPSANTNRIIMHICLPDTREVKPASGAAYLLYNVHIDGLYHCSLRYKQLLHLHQALSKRFTSPIYQLPPFPPKKLLPLSGNQIEERRSQLEKYLQNISQYKPTCNSSIFNLFLLEAQRESTRIQEGQVYLDVELVNGQKIRLQIVSHDSADAVLTAVCRALGLNDRYHAYFCLCLCGYDVVRDKLIIKRRLSFFESPYVTLQMAIQHQEQLQSVLSSAPNSASNHSTAPSTSITNNNNNNIMNYNYSNNNNNIIINNNISSNNCTCQSCSTNHQLQSTTTSSTSVPLVGSSSGSYVNSTSNQGLCNNNSNSNNNSNTNINKINDSNNYHNQRANNQQRTTSQVSQNYHQQEQVNCSNRQALAPTSGTSSYSLPSSSCFVTHRILLRKSYWDPVYDTQILNDQQALNLLFIQTVYDIKHSLMFVNRDTYHRLESLLASDSKLEYILLARTLKYYNYVHFEPCLSDYPRPKTKVMISIGSKELNMRVLKSPKSFPAPTATSKLSPIDAKTTTNSPNGATNANQQVCEDQILYCTSSLVPTGYQHLITKGDLVEDEYNFKVPLIRCWRLTSLETLNSNNSANQTTPAGANQARVRRKSLSLFNSVIGNSNHSVANVAGYRQATLNDPLAAAATRNIINHSGTGGASLLAALAGSHSCSYRRLSGGHNGPSNYNENGEPHDLHSSTDLAANQAQFSQYELSFEYLIAKDTLRWITISSDQAIFISISLQGVVDELVSKREGCPMLHKSLPHPAKMTGNGAAPSQAKPVSSPTLIGGNQTSHSFTYMYRDGVQKAMSVSNQKLIDKFGYSPTVSQPANGQQRSSSSALTYLSLSSSSRYSTAFGSPDTLAGYGGRNAANAFEITNFKKAPSPIINDAFEGVTNDEDF